MLVMVWSEAERGFRHGPCVRLAELPEGAALECRDAHVPAALERA